MRAVLMFSAVVAAATAAIAACASDQRAVRNGDASPGPGHDASAADSVPTCGKVPTSTGPLADVARVSVGALGPARAGEEVSVRVTLEARSDTQRVILTSASSALLLVNGDDVVARTEGDRTAGQIPLRLVAGRTWPAQAVPASIRLESCRGGRPLPAGQYAVVAVLGYEPDSLNTAADGAAARPTGSRSLQLVSAPQPITIT